MDVGRYTTMQTELLNRPPAGPRHPPRPGTPLPKRDPAPLAMESGYAGNRHPS